MKLHEDQPALLIFDQLKGQVTEKMFELLEENRMNIVLVPANCTESWSSHWTNDSVSDIPAVRKLHGR